MMQSRLSFNVAAIAALAALSGCAAAAGSDSPSLAKRAIEGTWNVPVAAPLPTPPGPLPADLAGRLARWESDARAADAAFEAERPTAERLVSAATGAGVASESWVVGQQALSRLQSTRAALTAALADLDRLYVERSVDEAIDGLPEIYALRDRLVELVASEDMVLTRLQEQLPGK